MVGLLVQPERRWVGARIGRPWKLAPELAPDPASLAELHAFDEPGWLKFGMEFVLTPTDAGTVVVQTSTICEATDSVAARRFRAYWAVIGPFSGLIRADMLAAIARRAEAA